MESKNTTQKNLIESEKYLDKKLVVEVEKLGGLCIKLVTTHFSGLPDRLCLMPGGKIFFAEIKTTLKKPRKIQIFVHNKLRDRGFTVYVIDTSKQIFEVLKSF
tara:strand:+ start:37617 stop:37925 length:309 start_codon:yes stop_codon:yes gene_type:complete